MKKFISLVLSFCVVMSLFTFVSISANAAGDYAYSQLDDGTIQIDGYSGSDSALVIPSKIEERTVTSIGNSAFANKSSIKSVTIPDTVTHIGVSAFSYSAYYNDKSNWESGVLYIGKFLIDTKSSDIAKDYTVKDGTTVIADQAFSYTKIETVSLPKTLVTVGTQAFRYCSSLKNVTIPEKVTFIGKNVFDSCKVLTEIKVDANNKAYCDVDGVLFNKAKTELIKFPEGSEKTTYTVPHSVKTIDGEALYLSSKLESVKLSSNVSTINKYSSDAAGFKEGVTLFVEKGSYAESYARVNNLKYQNWVATDHKVVVKNQKNATCFAKGYTGDKVCSECGYVLEKGKNIAKLKLTAAAFTAKGNKGKLTVTYKKVTGAKGYQVRYKIGKKTVTKTYNKAKGAKKIIKNLKKGKYTVQLRAFTKQGKNKVYSNWAKRTVKVK